MLKIPYRKIGTPIEKHILEKTKAFEWSTKASPSSRESFLWLPYTRTNMTKVTIGIVNRNNKELLS